MGNLESIADIQLYTFIEKIAEGCSGDEKYKLEKDGKYFLLRVGDRSKSSERKKEFDRLKTYADRDINTQARYVRYGKRLVLFRCNMGQRNADHGYY